MRRKTSMAPVPMPVSEDTTVSVSVRKIANGYIEERCVSGKGRYDRTETYTPTKPKVQVGSAPAKGRGK
jgi:hypothetical protein